MDALPPAAVISLRAHRERQEVEREMMGLPLTDDDLVFSYTDRLPLSPCGVSNAFGTGRSFGQVSEPKHDCAASERGHKAKCFATLAVLGN